MHYLCTPDSLSAFVACRLIPLGKCPGVRSIGVGEVLRRILAKAVLRNCWSGCSKGSRSLQVCAGLEAGCEAAVHAMSQISLTLAQKEFF